MVRLVRLLALSICLGLPVSVWAADDNDPVTWAFAFQNDFFFNSDDQFTGGGGIQMYSAVQPTLKQTHGTPALGKSLARFVLPHDAQLSYRESWVLGLAAQTPKHESERGLITDDFAYVNLVGLGNTFIAFNDDNFYGAQFLLGLVGPLTGGRQVQNGIHSAIGNNTAKGWRNQLDNEAVVNLYYTFKHKLWRAQNFDVASSFDAALGNYFTYGQTGLELRVGQLPAGFASMPDPFGRGMTYDATLPSRHQNYFYATFALRGTAIGVSLERQGNIFRTGNAWTERNTLRMEPFVGQFIAGLHYVRPRWGVHFNLWMTTDTVDPRSLTGGSDINNNFGAIQFDWRFN